MQMYLLRYAQLSILDIEHIAEELGPGVKVNNAKWQALWPYFIPFAEMAISAIQSKQ